MNPADKRTIQFRLSNDALFIGGFIIGVLCFLFIYDRKILDVTYSAWILTSPDPDISQHYLGAIHFMKSGWRFPVGLFDSLSYPDPMSVIWTDSIPGVCLILKLFRSFLPQGFQFFGWYGLISFGLTGGVSAVVIRTLIDSPLVSLLLSPVFVLSFPVLQLLYYHTALASHWLILLALLGFLQESSWSLKKRVSFWSVLGMLCVMIHSYFLPMIGVIMLAGEFLLLLQGKNPLRVSPIPVAGFCISGLFTLWILGAFTTPVNHSGYMIGGFNANLNTFWNSLGSGLLTGIENKYGTQYEGFAYLGLGMLLMLILASLTLAVKAFRKKAPVKQLILLHPTAFSIGCMFFVFFLISVFPEADLNTRTLIPDLVPNFIKSALGVFRSNGRFIWPAMYLLMISSVYVLYRYSARLSFFIILFICVFLQFADIFPYAKEKHSVYFANRYYMNVFDQTALNRLIQGYRHIVLVDDNVTAMMACADYAYRYDMTLNRFYFARDINDRINERLDRYRTGQEDKEGVLFIFYDRAQLSDWLEAGLHFYEYGSDGIVLGSEIPLFGLEELIYE